MCVWGGGGSSRRYRQSATSPKPELHTHMHTHRRYMLRNSMGACTTTIVRMARNARGRGRGFYPVSFSGSPRFVYPTSPVRATSFYPSPPYYDATKSSPVPEVSVCKELKGVGCLGRGVCVCGVRLLSTAVYMFRFLILVRCFKL